MNIRALPSGIALDAGLHVGLPIAVAVLFLNACSVGSRATPSPTAASSPSSDLPSASPSVPPSASTPNATPSTAPNASATSTSIFGTVVRFTSGSTAVDVTIDEDGLVARDFLSMLPLTLTFEEFNGREKIAYLPRELIHDESPGSDPEDGDLIYYVPWGNLGFYYDTSGIGYSDDTIHLGTYEASLDQLKQLEGDGVTVDIVP